MPTDTLEVHIHRGPTPDSTPGKLSLKCVASHCNTSQSTLQPVLQWYKDGEPLDQGYSSRSEDKICLFLEFASLKYHDNGEYTCQGRLVSPSMKDILIKQDTIAIIVPNGKHFMILGNNTFYSIGYYNRTCKWLTTRSSWW